MELPSVNYLAYKNALKQAWKDGRMSADESAMLDTLRKSLNISAEDHVNIEKEVRGELAGMMPENSDSGEEINYPTNQTNNMIGAGDETYDVNGVNGGNEIKDLLIAGKNSYHKGNYEEAIEYCDRVLLVDPDNSEALFFRKRTLSKIEKLEEKGADKKKSKPDLEPGPEPELEPGPEAPNMENTAVPETDMETPNVSNEQPSPEDVQDAQAPEPVITPAGDGDPNCKSCGGSGQCHWCRGSGKCYWCKGTGNCDKCQGSGEINGDQCKSCKGSGKCHSCNGDSTCYWCKGSGKCSKCLL
jgi:hypothetical protein